MSVSHKMGKSLSKIYVKRASEITKESFRRKYFFKTFKNINYSSIEKLLL